MMPENASFRQERPSGASYATRKANGAEKSRGGLRPVITGRTKGAYPSPSPGKVVATG